MRPLASDLRLFIDKILNRIYKNEKIKIKEEDVEEPYEEIIEQVDNTPEPIPESKPEPTPEPTPIPPLPKNKRQNAKCG